ncbi:MAG: hypothetical protein SFW09_12320 [Hyphomicrobiaceae bacterium]|nr:hypothetical protein [Hyphomicrobiaceae bacterium]
MAIREKLIEAVDAALDGQWDRAHGLVQPHEADATACWLHACLHKIEPDEQNSRYWYRRSGHSYEEYADPRAELAAIKAALTY